jgi:SPRY domain
MNRLDIQLVSEDVDDEGKWYSVYNTCGPWALKLYSKPLQRDLVQTTLEQMKQVSKDIEYSYLSIICRILDCVHPSHTLQANVLAYPFYSNQILKRRLVLLGYDTLSPSEESLFVLDNKTAIDILRQVDKRLEKEVHAYFEFAVPYNTTWRVGLVIAKKYVSFEHEKYPGDNEYGFGFGHTGKIFANGKEFKFKTFNLSYADSLCGSPTFENSKIIGILINLHEGSISLVSEGEVYPAAFGKDALAFDKTEQERQR